VDSRRMSMQLVSSRFPVNVRAKGPGETYLFGGKQRL
jgi:hypothetical protein